MAFKIGTVILHRVHNTSLAMDSRNQHPKSTLVEFTVQIEKEGHGPVFTISTGGSTWGSLGMREDVISCMTALGESKEIAIREAERADMNRVSLLSHHAAKLGKTGVDFA